MDLAKQSQLGTGIWGVGEGSWEAGMSVRVDANKGRMQSPGPSGRTMGWTGPGGGMEKEVHKNTTISTVNSLPFFKQDGLLYALGVPSPRG